MIEYRLEPIYSNLNINVLNSSFTEARVSKTEGAIKTEDHSDFTVPKVDLKEVTPNQYFEFILII